MTNKPKHKIWHESNFYIALGSFVGFFFAGSMEIKVMMMLSVCFNLVTALALCNKHNIEDLYKEKNDD